MSNIAGKAYAMNVVTPHKPGLTWIKALIFRFARCMPETLSGLLGLSIIHFARWAFIKRDQWPDLGQGKQDLKYDYMLFCSNFNGTWDQYIDAFSDGIPSGLDLFWYKVFKYPLSIPITGFKSYITHNQIHTDYYYNATPGSAQRDIKAALRVLNGLRELQEDHGKMNAGDFAKKYRRVLTHLQNSLASPGPAPVASNDTSNADMNRQDSVKAQQKRFQAAT